MAAPFRLSYQQGQKIIQSRPVRRKIAEVADRVAAGTRSIAASEGVKGAVTRQDGTRPKGRPFARISMPTGDEFGTAVTPRRRILGRAASAARRTR